MKLRQWTGWFSPPSGRADRWSFTCLVCGHYEEGINPDVLSDLPSDHAAVCESTTVEIGGPA